MDKQHRHHLNQSLLGNYLTAERLRLLDKSASPPPKPGQERFVIWGLITLQLVAAFIILTIFYPLGAVDARQNEIANFGAPSHNVSQQPLLEQLTPEAPIEPTKPTVNLDLSASPTPQIPTPQPQPSSLVIRGLEITQGIQVFNEPENPACYPDTNHPHYIFCNNSAPLVAGRHTLLRLYLACNGDCPTTETTVQIRLLKDGVEQSVLSQRLSAAWLAQVNPLPLPELRLNLDHSINFKLFPPPAWLSGQITFAVEAKPEALDQPPVTLSLTKNFALRRPLRVAYLPIQYQGALPQDVPDLDHWLLRLYPVPGVEYYRLPVPDLVWDKTLDKGELLNELLYIYRLYTQHNPSETWPDQLFGWLPQEFYNGGAADPAWCSNCAGPHSSRVAFGGIRPEQDIGGPRILAHEIAHNLGAQHAWSPTEQQDSVCFKAEGADIQVDPTWPYAQSPYIQEVGVDVYSDPPVIYTPNFYDIMSYCANPWVSPHTYRKIFDSPILQPEAIQTDILPSLIERPAVSIR